MKVPLVITKNVMTMKPLKTLGSLIALSSLLFLLPSCQKDLEDVTAKSDETIGLFNGGCSPCAGEYINLTTHRRGTEPFFWRGGKHDAPQGVQASCKQTFNGRDFTNQQFFVMTATGGVPNHVASSGAIGVNDGYIDAGESLILTLSPCMADYVMKSFDLTFNAGKTTTGIIELTCNGEWRESINFVGYSNPKTPGKGTINFPIKYISKQQDFCFSQIEIKVLTGRVQWVGYQRNLNTDLYYEATRFHIVPRNPS